MGEEEEKKKSHKFGNYIKSKRIEKGWSIIEVGTKLDVSPNYISLLERGLRIPTDETIHKLTILYEEDEYTLYKLLVKIPKSVIEEIKNYPMLQRAISFANKKEISDEKRKEIEEELLNVYAEFLNVNKNEFNDN